MPSLIANQHDLPGPEPQDYTKMFSIPLEERCDACEGMGLVRWRHSMNGLDWMKCWICHGSGRAPAEMLEAMAKDRAHKAEVGEDDRAV
jgi:excinuclease UvrABC ATPase subunit